jgi:hypothetical protein
MPYYSANDVTAYWSIDPSWSTVSLAFSINQWYNFSATYNNSTRLMTTYINGILALSGTRPGLGDLNNPNNASVQIYGCNNVSSANSQVTSVNMYNRALSALEIEQNFNAHRGRYGI